MKYKIMFDGVDEKRYNDVNVAAFEFFHTTSEAQIFHKTSFQASKLAGFFDYTHIRDDNLRNAMIDQYKDTLEDLWKYIEEYPEIQPYRDKSLDALKYIRRNAPETMAILEMIREKELVQLAIP